MSFSIHCFRTGHMKGLPGPEVYWMSDWDEKYPADFIMAVIRGEGQTILVKTGPPPDMLEEMNAHWRSFRGEDTVLHVREEEHPLAHLSRLQLRPEDVTAVIATPFQNYATGNLDLFPQARIFFSRTGWLEFMAPRWKLHPHDIPRFCFPPRVLRSLVTEARERLELVDERELFPGLGVFWTGCHHRSSLAVWVQTERGRVILSDCFFRYGNIERPHPLGINENLYECLEAYERIRREADLLVPLYDPEVFQRHPGGIVAA